MKKQFLSKSVPRGTRTIWRYLGALFILFTFAIGNVWADTTYSLFDGDGNFNSEDFFCTKTPSDVNYTLSEVNYTKGITFTGTLTATGYNKNTDRYIRYDMKTTKIVVEIVAVVAKNKDRSISWAYVKEPGTSTSASAFVSSGTLALTKNTSAESIKKYTLDEFTTTTNTSFVISVPSSASDVKILQVNVIEKGTELLKKPGDDGYAFRFQEGASTSAGAGGRHGGGKAVEVHYEGGNFVCCLNSEHTAGTGLPAKLTTKGTHYIKFTTSTYSQVNVTVGSSNAYYISKSKNPSSGTTYTADASVKIEAGTWYIVPNGSDVTIKKISFEEATQATDIYTVKYMDGTTELGTETVEVGSKPTASSINKNKDFYTFEAWQLSGVDKLLTDDSWKSVAKDATVTLTARYSGPTYSSSATLISADVVSSTPNVNTVLAASNIVSSITFDSKNYEFTSNETKPGYYGYKDKASGDYMKIMLKQGKRAQVLFGNLGADPTITVNGVAKSLDAARTTGDMAENTFTWTASAEDALISITMGSGTNTLKKVDVIQLYTATREDGKSDGAGSDPNVLVTTLPTPTAIFGWTFTGWVANQDVKAGEDTKTAGTVLAAGTYTLLENTTFTAQWTEASSTYDITYVSAHGTAPAADNAASVVLAELAAEGWAHKGWTANADVTVDAATVEAGTLIANGKTVILASNVTFTAVWKEIFTVTFNSKGGSAVDPIDVEDGASIAAAPADPTKDDYVFQGWSETDGGAVVADITALTISGDKTLYASWALDVQVSEIVFSNSFKGWIVGSTVTVFYMAGESAPTITSYAGKNLKAEGGVVISGDKIIATGTDDSEIEFALTMTEVTPLIASGSQTFDGTEGYIKTRHEWTADRKWKMSKYATDGRVARGETSMYIFLGAAESVTLDWGAQKVTNDVAVYVNGTFVKNIGKNNNSAIPLTGGNNIVALYSLQTSGDIWLDGLSVVAYVPTTGVALQEGDDPISSKTIWEGENFTLTAVVSPDNASDKTITWTSSDDAIATVVDGVVTGVAANASPVTITATTVDGVYATCEVTVTTAPTPSAAPTITTQPASDNYYEGATITALEVVATGSGDLSYQWYLGSDEIDGATAPTYTPIVSAIGSYVYHCVVTNTETGHLPTSLASNNATITIAEDPAAIKLFDGEGNLNTTNFISPAKTTIEIADVEHVCLAEFSSNRSSLGGATPTDMVKYDVTTDKAKIQMTFYNNNSGVKKAILYKYEEGGTPEKIEIEVPGQTIYTTDYFAFNSSKNRSFYVCMNDRSNIRVLQVKVVDNGTNPVKQFGQVGYSLNLNKARFYAKAAVEKSFEGFTFTPSSDYKVYNNSNLATTSANSFTIASPAVMSVKRSGGKYYIYQDPADKGTLYSADAEIELNATGTWYISSETTSSAASFTKIEFLAPKCQKPVFGTMSDIDLCAGDAFTAIDGTATVSDGGVVSYKWYKEGSETVLGTAATYTPSDDGNYYVVATNSLADHQDNSATSDVVTVEHFDAAAIVTAPEDIATQAGQEKTLTIVASGANLQYVWYTCDDAEGTNPVAIVPAQTTASLTVTVPDGVQYYKVAVTDDCGADLSAVVKVEGWTDLPQVDVTESTVWDMTNVSANAINLASMTPSKQNVRLLLANIEGVNNNASFNSQALMFEGQHIGRTGAGIKHLAGRYLQFNVTVPGAVFVTFESNGDNARTISINGKKCARTTSGTAANDYITYALAVEPGSVEIIGYEGESANQYIRISKIEFKAEYNYHRENLNPNNIGTLCWTNNAVLGGATLYELVGKNEYNKLVFEEVDENRLEAGKPYIFVPENGNTEIRVYNTDTEDALTQNDLQAVNGMHGTFVNLSTIDDGENSPLWNKYIITNNHYVYVDYANCRLGAYRAYITSLDDVAPANPEPSQNQNGAPRRRIVMGAQSEQVATGCENLNVSDKPVKMIINGQLFILRGEKMYDAKGQLVK